MSRTRNDEGRDDAPLPPVPVSKEVLDSDELRRATRRHFYREHTMHDGTDTPANLLRELEFWRRLAELATAVATRIKEEQRRKYASMVSAPFFGAAMPKREGDVICRFCQCLIPECYCGAPMNEEQVTLQAIRQHIEAHPSRELIESVATKVRAHAHDEAGKLAIALVGAELAAAP